MKSVKQTCLKDLNKHNENKANWTQSMTCFQSLRVISRAFNHKRRLFIILSNMFFFHESDQNKNKTQCFPLNGRFRGSLGAKQKAHSPNFSHWRLSRFSLTHPSSVYIHPAASAAELLEEHKGPSWFCSALCREKEKHAFDES
jgi:hypothetical protein